MGNIFSISLSCDALFSVCLHCTVRKATYICKLENNVNSLQNELQKLIEERDDVKRRVVIAEQRQMQRLNQVQGWFSRVEAVETEAGELIRDSSQEIEKSCLGGYCSKNCKSTFKFGKKVAENLQVVAKLRAEGAFEVVAERWPEAAVDERPTEPTVVGLQSTLDKVWKCLGDEQVGIIGLYGMGGVGKTTLLTQINNRFIDIPYDFDIVIWVVVSKNIQLENIQDTIMKRIGSIDESWKNRSLEEKALVIFKILSQKKFVLLLDDIWERVDLIKVGVPLSTLSKVVFTTRSFEVCGAMKAQESFRVECLGFEEARKLFQENLQGNILNSHPDIPGIAETIVEECGGLPLVLVTIGRAMSCKKTVEEWRYAVLILKSSASKFAGMGTEVYPLLKFSYDSLPNDTIRSCLLYCCLFSEDYRIHKAKLIDYWIDEELVGGLDRSELYNQGFYIVGVLVNACLLEEEEEEKGEYLIKMHDVIRDMILWVADEIEEKGKFLVHAGSGLIKAPKIEKWVGIRRMSLMENKIKNLPEIPSCPNLQTLFLNRNHLKTIKNGFFQSLSSLKVLNLSNNKNLCKLPSGISNLVSLQHLDLSKTDIEELPRELKALVNLKYLNLEYTFYLRIIPWEVRSNFSMLRVLRMHRSGFCGQMFNFKFLGELLVGELLLLKHLNVLTITLKSFYALQRILTSTELKSCIQYLSLEEFQDDQNASFDLSSLTDLKHLHTLDIIRWICLAKLEIELGGHIVPKSGFYSLKTVRIVYCDKLRDVTSLIFVPNLKFLYINHCHEMEEIISVVKLDEVIKMVGNLKTFANLQFLRLRSLPNLKSIYSGVLHLPHLKEIDVVLCPKLRKLPLGANGATDHKIIIKGGKRWCKELHWDDEATQKAVLFLVRSFID